MKTITLLLCLVAAQSVQAEPSQPITVVRNQVVAVVNNDVVTMTEVLRTMPPALRPAGVADVEWLRFRLKQFKERLEGLIDQRLLYQEAKLADITVDDTLLDKVIERRWQGTFKTEKEFLDYLGGLKMSEREFREQVRRELMAREIVRRRIQLDQSISPAEALAYYNENIAEFSDQERRRLRIIQLPLKVESGESGAKAARDLVKKLRSTPGAFAQMAKKSSIGPGATDGGEIGWVERDRGLKKELRDAAFALKEGEISDVVTTQGGFFILKVEEIKAGKVTPFEEAQVEVRDIIQNQRFLADRKKLLDDLKERGYVLTFLPDPDLLR